LPKRLINIGSSTESLRLITPNEDTAYKYALLSYCWGGDQAGKTLRSNLPLYQTSIPTHNLSASIRDAIAVTRILGLEYLWVDSLCMNLSFSAEQTPTDRLSTPGILQDDAEELTMENSKQARVYQNGVVTVLAGGARSAGEDFLQKRQNFRPSCRIKIQLPDSDLPKIELLFHFFNVKGPKVQDPINSRAWIFQEGRLSLMALGITVLTWYSSALFTHTVF
jgi:hypothetical protein